MAIDISSETLLSMGQAARKFPPYRQNRPVNPSTIWRWICDGVKLRDGTVVRLEGVRCGDRWLTSQEAIARFIDAQTPNLDGERIATPVTGACRNKVAQKAGEQLQRLGF
jgi:hypothetical protein